MQKERKNEKRNVTLKSINMHITFEHYSLIDHAIIIYGMRKILNELCILFNIYQ